MVCVYYAALCPAGHEYGAQKLLEYQQYVQHYIFTFPFFFSLSFRLVELLSSSLLRVSQVIPRSPLELKKQAEFSDITLVSKEGKSIQCHKCVLVARSGICMYVCVLVARSGICMYVYVCECTSIPTIATTLCRTCWDDHWEDYPGMPLVWITDYKGVDPGIGLGLGFSMARARAFLWLGLGSSMARARAFLWLRLGLFYG